MYDRDAAVAYAREWAFGRNPRYMNFQGIGGDCTNFISQCLHAGGAPMNFTKDLGWYFNTAHDRAAAWTGVEYLYRFLTGESRPGPKGKAIPIVEIQPGDLIQLSFLKGQFSHSLLVVGIGEVPAPDNVLIATHSNDSLDRPLSSYDIQAYRCLQISK